jgi:hypothetical protein
MIHDPRLVSVFFVSLLLLTSCLAQHRWLTQRIATGNTQYDSLRLYYPALDKVNDIEVEILKTNEMCSLSLAVHGQPVPACEGDPEHALIRVKIADASITERASLHAGGQRIQPSSTLQEAILRHLRSGGAIEIELHGYRKKILADNFPQLAEQLDDLPHFRNPIRLPF